MTDATRVESSPNLGEDSIPEENDEEITPGEAADESNDGEPPEEVTGEIVAPEGDPEYDQRVARLLGMIEQDPTVRDRMICEMYVTLAEFSEQIRGAQAMMSEVGPRAFISAMFGRGGHGGNDDE